MKILSLNEFVNEGLFNKNDKTYEDVMKILEGFVSSIIEGAQKLKIKNFDGVKTEDVMKCLTYDDSHKSIVLDYGSAAQKVGNIAEFIYTKTRDYLGNGGRCVLKDVKEKGLSEKDLEKIKERILDETTIGAAYVLMNKEHDSKCNDIFKKWKREDLEYINRYGAFGYMNVIEDCKLRRKGDKDSHIDYYKLKVDEKSKVGQKYLRFSFGSEYEWFYFDKENLADKCAENLKIDKNIETVNYE